MKIIENNSNGYIENGVLVKYNGRAYENPINTACFKIQILINQTGDSFDNYFKDGYFNGVDAILVGNSPNVKENYSVFNIIKEMNESIRTDEIKGNSGVKKFVEDFKDKVKNDDIDNIYDFLKSVKKYKKFRSRISPLVDALVKLRINYEKQKKKSLAGKESKFVTNSIDKAKSALSDVCKLREKGQTEIKLKTAYDALCASARFDSKREAKTKKAESNKVKTGLIPWYNKNKKAKTTEEILNALINIKDYIPTKEGLFWRSRLTKLKIEIEQLTKNKDKISEIFNKNS